MFWYTQILSLKNIKQLFNQMFLMYTYIKNIILFYLNFKFNYYINDK
jgi:hypothetical protein